MLDPKDALADGQRNGISFQALFAIGLLGCLVTAAGAWFAYRELIHYDRRAALHLLPDTVFAARLDVEQVILFEPVRRHLVPLLDAPLTGALRPASDTAAPVDRVRALRDATGLNLGLDLRELLVARGAGGDWLVVLGGFFPETGLVRGIETELRRQGIERLSLRDDVLVFEPWGAALGQAADGVLMLASDRTALEKTFEPNHVHRELGLPREGAAGVVLKAELLRSWISPELGPDTAWMTQLHSVIVTLQLRSRLELELTFHGGDADAEVAHQTLALARERLALDPGPDAPVPLTDRGVARAILARARVARGSVGAPQLLSFLEASELESSARTLATWVEIQLSSLGPKD